MDENYQHFTILAYESMNLITIINIRPMGGDLDHYKEYLHIIQ